MTTQDVNWEDVSQNINPGDIEGVRIDATIEIRDTNDKWRILSGRATSQDELNDMINVLTDIRNRI